MDKHEHASSGGTLASFEELAHEFGPAVPGTRSGGRIVGDYYLAVVAEQAKIIEHQWSNGIERGMVRGFFLSGPPGVGKTTLAKRLGYELGLRFPRRMGRDGVATVLLDGSAIARSKYGESETRIREIFQAAQDGLGTAGQRSVLIFDDVESIFMARGSAPAKEWHFSQDSVFFHAVDELDTSRTTVVLTSNRPDLVDEAIRDRFLAYKVPHPSADVLTAVAHQLIDGLGLAPDQAALLGSEVHHAVLNEAVRSLRDVEHLVFRRHIAALLGSEPLASTQSDR